jgi:hypothetical protein
MQTSAVEWLRSRRAVGDFSFAVWLAARAKHVRGWEAGAKSGGTVLRTEACTLRFVYDMAFKLNVPSDVDE